MVSYNTLGGYYRARGHALISGSANSLTAGFLDLELLNATRRVHPKTWDIQWNTAIGPMRKRTRRWLDSVSKLMWDGEDLQLEKTKH